MNFLRSFFKREAKTLNKQAKDDDKKGKNPQPGDGDSSGEKKGK